MDEPSEHRQTAHELKEASIGQVPPSGLGNFTPLTQAFRRWAKRFRAFGALFVAI